MRDYLAKFRDKRIARGLLAKIGRLAEGAGHCRLMEVCGTHTVAIYRYGLRDLLPRNVELLSGPGCPVCVTDLGYIDKAIALARLDDVLVVTFGDLMKVPGSTSSLLKEKGAGRKVKVVYSPIESLAVARENPGKKVVFLSVGFETTIPAILATVRQAEEEGVENFYLLGGNKLVPPAMEFLLEDGTAKIDGFICPGHVSTIIGSKAYEPLTKKHRVPCVVAGFEPTDVLRVILVLLEQLRKGRAEVANEYQRAVRAEGNLKAQELMAKYCVAVDENWRGIGVIAKSGLRLGEELGHREISTVMEIEAEPTRKKRGCICGQVLQGLARPVDCKLFGKVCRPEEPVGACMVSGEGSCAAAFRHSVWEE